MPRPINTTTRVGQLRALLRLNSASFSQLAGISPSMLAKCEQGIERLSRESCERMAFSIGISPEWLQGEGEDHMPMRFDLDTGTMVPFTREDFETKRRKNLSGPLHPFLARMHEARALELLALFRTAERHGKLGNAYYLFSRLREDVIERLALTDGEVKRMRRTFKEEQGKVLKERKDMRNRLIDPEK